MNFTTNAPVGRFRPDQHWHQPDAPPDNQPDTAGQNPVINPNNNSLETRETLVKKGPAPSGHDRLPPDGWIGWEEAQRRFADAGIEIKGRPIRRLCQENKIESEKFRNDQNKWQHFMNPTSVDTYIAKLTRGMASGQQPIRLPVTSTTYPVNEPGTRPDALPQSVEPSAPAPFGHPDKEPDQGRGREALLIELATAKAQLEGKDALIEELRTDKKHLRDDLKVANDFRDHIMTLANGSRDSARDLMETVRFLAEQSNRPEQQERPTGHQSSFREGEIA